MTGRRDRPAFGGVVSSGAEPVRHPAPTDAAEQVREGVALCLSGGGYRAMLFHVGVLWRLNEAGWLPRLDRVSSVSGGSLTAAVLGLHWARLGFDDTGVAQRFGDAVVGPVRRLAREDVDVQAVVTGAALPFTSVNDRLAAAYRRHLVGDASLRDLPEEPRFVLNAANLESGALMRFSREYVADHRVGMVEQPDLPLAVAAAASSAFPPFLSPCVLRIPLSQWRTKEGNDLTSAAHRSEIALSDGGVYDNLGLETAWSYRTLIVSDAGGLIRPDADPPHDWGRHVLRVLDVIDNQVRSLRKRQLIEALQAGTRRGVYVGIRSQVASFGLPDAMPADPDLTDALAATPTRLAGLSEERQEQLIDWGYTIADAGLRRHLDPEAPRGRLPYPQRWPRT